MAEALATAIGWLRTVLRLRRLYWLRAEVRFVPTEAQRLFDHESSTMGAFALVGMGAAFSGIVRAPMTSVLIIIEMTGGYSLILPLMIANMIAHGLARRVRPVPLYEALLAQDGIRLRDKGVMDALEGINLEDVYARDGRLTTFEPTPRAGEIVRAAGAQEVYPVVDASHKIVGILTSEELETLHAEPDLALVVNAADLMRPPLWVTPKDDLRTALEMMLANKIRRLPVVDGGKLAGFVDEDAIAKAYLREQTAGKDTDAVR